MPTRHAHYAPIEMLPKQGVGALQAGPDGLDRDRELAGNRPRREAFEVAQKHGRSIRIR